MFPHTQRENVNILNKHERAADKVWSSHQGTEWEWH